MKIVPFDKRRILHVGDTLEETDDLTTSVLWVEAAEEMDMVLITAEFFNGQIVALCDAEGNFLDCCNDRLAQERFAVFDGKDEVIV